MEQHPVPQNITSFQFKLVGDMTIRQFIYLAGGVIVGYLILQLGWPAIIKWPLAFFVGASGFGLAFVPIEERPLDRWVISFFQRIYSPTQFLWQKRGIPPEILTAPVPVSTQPPPETIRKEATMAQVDEYLKTLPTEKPGDMEKKQIGLLDQVLSLFAGKPATYIPLSDLTVFPKVITTMPTPTPPPVTKTDKITPVAPPVIMAEKPLMNIKPSDELSDHTEQLTRRIFLLQQELANQQITKDRLMEIQAQLSKLLEEKEDLTRELIDLRRKLANKTEPVVRPTTMAKMPEEPSVKIVSSTVAPKVGMPSITEVKNAPSGIVKAPKGSVLPGIIVEIRNQEGTPVRALKSGKLGQFSVSTPLPNGVYTLHLEDPQKNFYFDILEITLRGNPMAPLEIFGKTEKDRLREELSKKLFSQDKF
ncbi:MAG: PrgI family protein [Candidatus Gottesmanbacteria bacterium]